MSKVEGKLADLFHHAEVVVDIHGSRGSVRGQNPDVGQFYSTDFVENTPKNANKKQETAAFGSGTGWAQAAQRIEGRTRCG